MSSGDPEMHDDSALLAAIVDSADDVIVSKDLSGIIISWNRAAERTFGYTAQEAVGQSIKLIIPQELHSEEDEILARVRRGEKVDHFQTVRQTKDGRRIDVSVTISPVRDKTGRIIGASKVARDISRQRELEREREEALARAETAYRRAQEADRAKDEFLAVLSHELRSPLTAIINWTSLLMGGGLTSEKVQRAYASILRSAELQEQLISDLLDVSRIITGKLRLNLECVDLHTVVQSAIETVQPAAEAKGVRLQVTMEGDAIVMGDGDRLQQIFWNLLSNAVKFTPKNGRVQVLLERIDSHFEVTVADTGIGIRPEVLPYIFERFRQGDSSPSRQHGGLGLGLAIVRHLVEQHGGTVIASSEGEGHGSVFTVRLPIAPVSRLKQAGGRDYAGASGSLFDQPGPSLKQLRILLVDDEEEARDAIATILSQAEAEVRVAGSAAQAQEILNEWHPDILVSDIGMPGEDGYAFMRKVRARSNEEGGNVPAVALTAYARAEDRLRILSAGYQMHVPKPARRVELLTVIASLARRL